MYPVEYVKTGTLWRHQKSGGLYIVLGTVTNSTNGESNGQCMVLYAKVVAADNATETKMFCREINEFLDGRFLHVKTS